MERQEKFQGSQNILRAPQQNRVAVFSKNAEVDGKFWKRTNMKLLHTAWLTVQVYGYTDLKRRYLPLQFMVKPVRPLQMVCMSF